MKMLFVCAGTAGHINPAIAVAEQFRKDKPNSDILFVGAGKKLENKLVGEAGFKIVNIEAHGLMRSFSPTAIAHNIKVLIALMTARKSAKKILADFQPDVILGTGGYVCYPIVKAAKSMKIPVYLIEPNAIPGLATRKLSSIARKIFVGFPDMERYFGKEVTVLYTGTPLRADFYTASQRNANLSHDEKPLIVSFWGSNGAAIMNEMIVDFIKLNLKNSSFNHIHAAGVVAGKESIMKGLSDSGISEVKPPLADIRDYIDNMPSVLKAASLVICRAGASTIAEVVSLGIPAILVPSPNVVSNHQYQNAKKLSDNGGCILITEPECSGELLYTTSMDILSDLERYQKMSALQKSIFMPNPAKAILSSIYHDNDL